MLRYWKLLEAAALPEDRYACVPILDADSNECWKNSGRAARFLTRKVIYPAIVKTRARSGMIHILDHSWADLLPFTPTNSLKVVTVHDLIPLRFPGELNAAQAKRFSTWVSNLRQADAIVAVSEYTKREVMDLLGIDGNVIHVVSNGVEMPPTTPVPRDRAPGKTSAQPFRIGSIGSILERKNLSILPEAIARLQATMSRKVELVRVGAKLPPSLVNRFQSETSAGTLTEFGQLPDRELADFYASMDAVVVPSLYEGFGLPVLEALAWGVPVVASQATSLPEVGGEEAIYFNPSSPSELAVRLEEIAKNGMPEGWHERAIAKAASHSWRRSLEGVFSVYDQLMQTRKS